MTHKCCVRDCEEAVKETRARGLPLHKFPKDALLRSRWVASGGFAPDFRPSSSQIVCYKHFRQADYEVGRSQKLYLKKGSVPSVFTDYKHHPDPISPDSALITSRVQARELKLSQILASTSDADLLSTGLDSPLDSSLETSLDSTGNSMPTRRDPEPGDATAPAEPSMASSSSISNLPAKVGLECETKFAQINPIAGPSGIAIMKQTAAVVIGDKKKENDNKTRMYSRTDLSFMPGSKLEAKDFNEKWYSAKVVETDWGEREVLIHFDKWSSRFDEWIPMDSSRLRQASNSPMENKPKVKEFEVEEKVLATWADGKKYPAKVTSILGNDKYNVLFDDGFAKQLKASKITKLTDMLPHKMLDESAYVGSKQERRDKNRKHTVTELFQNKKKIKSEGDKLFKKQDFADVSNVKCITKFETSGFVKTEPIPGIENQQNVVTTSHIDGDYATFIGNLRVEIEDSNYKCPISKCNKNFRKENLLQMHIKHYHPEFTKYLGSTPNVADLAYARTTGGSVEDIIPKKSRISSQSNQATHGMLPMSPVIDSDLSQTELDYRLDNKYSTENTTSILEDNLSEQSNSCTMSPGRLFDMRLKEEKTHTGIKTLLPVRQPTTTITDDSEYLLNVLHDGSKPISVNEKGKLLKKRHQYYNDPEIKTKKQRGLSEHEESNDHFDDSFMDGDSTSDINNVTATNGSEIENDGIIQNKNNDLIIVNGEIIKVEKLRKEEIINCTCGITEEDGLMIQCDLCLCWQHGHCNGIEKEKDVPEKYVCYLCQHSFRQRPSRKYFHDQDWIKEGKLNSVNKHPSNIEKSNKKTAMLKRNFDLSGGVIQIKGLLQSLRVKINTAHSKDHPKLYLWAKNWSKVEIPDLKTEAVPIMEVIKAENYDNGKGGVFEKLEFELSINKDSDDKLITSDTELMKILEEDGTQVEDSKPIAKHSELNNSKEDGRILLDALTQNGIENEAFIIKKGFDNEDLSSKRSTDIRLNLEKSYKAQVASSQTGSKILIASQPVIPEPEAPIDLAECKSRLKRHVTNLQNCAEANLNFLESQVSNLEDNLNSNNNHVHTKQTLLMLLRDLETARKLAALC